MTQHLRVQSVRARCRQYALDERKVTYRFKLKDFGVRYNGNGFRGNGGPKTEWLKAAVNDYLDANYPELKETMLKSYFAKQEGWALIFTVPYWASSQPIEQVKSCHCLIVYCTFVIFIIIIRRCGHT